MNDLIGLYCSVRIGAKRNVMRAPGLQPRLAKETNQSSFIGPKERRAPSLGQIEDDAFAA